MAICESNRLACSIDWSKTEILLQNCQAGYCCLSESYERMQCDTRKAPQFSMANLVFVSASRASAGMLMVPFTKQARQHGVRHNKEVHAIALDKKH